jgi:hypothetical protein
LGLLSLRTRSAAHPAVARRLVFEAAIVT